MGYISQVKLERISKLSTDNVGHFVANFVKLIQIFRGRIDNYAFSDVNDKWNFARRVLKCDREIMDHIYGYFLKFEDEILSGNDKAMLDYDYTKLIVKDCEGNTKELILTLVDNIKGLYSQGDEEVNKEIRELVISITKTCARHREFKKILNID